MRFFLKSTNPRTPRTFVDRVNFEDEYRFNLWKSHFLKTSEFRVRHLSIGAVTARALQWIRPFTQIEELSVNEWAWRDFPKPISLAHLHRLSPTLKSLHLIRHSSSLSEVFNFVRSFPLLENLRLDVIVPFGTNFDLQATSSTSPSPLLTGTLVLDVPMNGGIRPIVTKLLEIPDGLRFRRIEVRSPVVTDGSTMELVSSCSQTLKSLHIDYTGGKRLVSTVPESCSIAPPPLSDIPSPLVFTDPILSLASPDKLDLSKATRLEEVELRWNRPEVGWITNTLETVRRRTIRRITIRINPNFILYTPIYEWYGLDLLLDKLWCQTTISISISCCARLQKRAMELLPLFTRRSQTEVLLVEDHGFHSYDSFLYLDNWKDSSTEG